MKVYMVVNVCHSPGKIAAIFDKRINASRYLELLDYPYEWAIVTRKVWPEVPLRIVVGQ